MNKRPIIAVVLFMLITILSSCGKDDTTSPNDIKANATITIANGGNGTFGGIDHQFTSLELSPTDGSSSAKTYIFVSSLHTTISVEVNLPKTGSYKMKVYANNSAGYIQWKSIAMTIGGTTPIYLYCPGNMSYKDGSTAAGIAPDISSGL